MMNDPSVPSLTLFHSGSIFSASLVYTLNVVNVFNGENRATIACYIDAANSCTCCDDDPFNEVCTQREQQGVERCPGMFFLTKSIYLLLNNPRTRMIKINVFSPSFSFYSCTFIIFNRMEFKRCYKDLSDTAEAERHLSSNILPLCIQCTTIWV